MKEDRSAHLKISEVPDDSFYTAITKEHSLDKYRAISVFLNIFSTGMKNKWDELVYIDLFSGPGKSKIETSKKIYPGSPWLALTAKDKFQKYIFCELEKDKAHALSQRISKFFPDSNSSLIWGNVNSSIEEIKSKIPIANKSHKVLSLCVVDPFNIESLRFNTIQSLNNGYMDFFVLIPSFMDARRNQTRYLDPSDNAIDSFLNEKYWRSKWIDSKSKGMKFGLFILDQFGQKMKSLGFLYTGPEKAITIFISSKNVPLYHLYLFSKHELGLKYWEETRKCFTDQLPLI